MKARIKATGKLLENVIPIMSVDSKFVMFHEYGTENDYYYYEDLDFSNTIDWEQTRIQAAIAAMQSYISDGERMALVSKKFDYNDKIISRFIAEGAVMYADALVAELQKKGGQNE